ncbi:MAG: lysophospholipid acyltransferase family protein [Bacilli bacterium]
MLKYIRYVFTVLLHLLFLYPKLCYYDHHQDKVPYEKRLGLFAMIVNQFNKVGHVEQTIIGLENIPASNKLVFCPNHQSFTDPTFMIIDKNHVITPVAKAEIKKMPFFGKMISCVGTIFFQRNDLRETYYTVKKIQGVLENEGNILIYLEGTRSKYEDHHMNPFKPAALKPAMAAKATIVPVFLWGFFRPLDFHCKQKTYPVTIEFLKPIPPEEYAGLTNVELSDKIHALIEAKVNAAIAEKK